MLECHRNPLSLYGMTHESDGKTLLLLNGLVAECPGLVRAPHLQRTDLRKHELLSSVSEDHDDCPQGGL